MTIQLTTLDSGLRVVTEMLPGARSVTTGFWVGVGGRDEDAGEVGASHFLEHLLFKGTASRSAGEIAESIDAVGGEMNAFTAQEHTAYFTRLPAADLELGLDVLSDVVWAPALRANEVEAERQVILEEIAMEEDTPDDRVIVLLGEALFPDHPLGREVLGSRESISAMTRDDIGAFHERWYRPGNVVVAVAGGVDHDAVVAAVAGRVPGSTGGSPPVRSAPERPPVAKVISRRTTEQAHLAIGWRSFARDDPDRFALAVANQILGAGMSSRLFQAIREERGFAYSVYSYTAGYADAGALVVYAGTSPARLETVEALVEEEIARFLADGPTEAELRVAKGYLGGSTVLSLEDSGGCMSRIGKAILNYGAVMPLDDLLERYRDVTLDDVRRVSQRVLGGDRSVAVVGPRTRRPPRTRRAAVPTRQGSGA